MKKEKLQLTAHKYNKSSDITKGQPYANRMDTVKEVDKFLQMYNSPGLNQEEKAIMTNPITSTEIEAVIKNLSKKQKSRTRWLQRRILSNI